MQGALCVAVDFLCCVTCCPKIGLVVALEDCVDVATWLSGNIVLQYECKLSQADSDAPCRVHCCVCAWVLVRDWRQFKNQERSVVRFFKRNEAQCSQAAATNTIAKAW